MSEGRLSGVVFRVYVELGVSCMYLGDLRDLVILARSFAELYSCAIRGYSYWRATDEQNNKCNYDKERRRQLCL